MQHFTYSLFVPEVNSGGACLAWTFRTFPLIALFPLFFIFIHTYRNRVNSPRFSTRMNFRQRSNIFCPSQMCLWTKACRADEKERGPREWSSGLFGTTREVGWEVTLFFLYFCFVFWAKSIFFLCGSCKECVFLFFCGECVGTAEWDGVIPEVNAISLRHT